MNKIKITIEGPPACGKSTIAYMLKALLVEGKFDATVIDDCSKEALDVMSHEALIEHLESRLQFIPRDSKIIITTKRKGRK